MISNKQLSSKSVQFAKGGSGSMFGKSGVTNQQPGVTGTTGGSPTGGKGGSKVSGGSGHMFGKSSVKNAKPV